MSSESEDLTTFVTFFDIYKYKVMLFELINEFAFFQHYINNVLFNCLHNVTSISRSIRLNKAETIINSQCTLASTLCND